MKKVLENHNQVAHYWAAQAQPEGRANNMFFSGDTLYSYGTHYAIARIYKREDGARLALFNARGYSVSTAKHTSIARRAVSHITSMTAVDHAPAFHGVPDHAANINYFINEGIRAVMAARRAKRNAIMHADDRDTWENCFKQYTAFFNVDTANVPAFPSFEAGELATFKEKRAIYDALEDKRQEARKAAHMAAALDKFDAWKAGEDVSTSQLYAFPGALRIKGDRVETSRGAAVTIPAARVAIAAWQAGTLTPGQDIGPYTLNQATPEGVKIGCHDIPAAAIEELAALLAR
jgi:hypothetical protein